MTSNPPNSTKPKYIHSFSLNFTYESELLGEDPAEEAIVLADVKRYLKDMLSSNKDLDLEWWGTEDKEEICVDCGRDNTGYGDHCTSDDCPSNSED
jgi:hypothetical protein